MFNLNEDFKKDFESFLLEEANTDLDDALSTINEGYAEAMRSINVVQHYFNVYPVENLNEDITILNGGKARVEDDVIGGTNAMLNSNIESNRKLIQQNDELSQRNKALQAENDALERKRAEVEYARKLDEIAAKYSPENVVKARHERAEMQTKEILDLVKLVDAEKRDGEMTVYTPEIGMVKAQTIRDMKFPKNIIFFIQQIVTWIGKFVKTIISKVTNAIRRLVGMNTIEDEKLDLGIKLAKLTKIQSAFGSMPNAPSNSKDYKYFSMSYVEPDKLEMLKECKTIEEVDGLVLTEAGDPRFREGISTNDRLITDKVPVITINLADNFDDLKLVLDKFFELFDSAYGSFGEQLFATDDLELVLSTFNDLIGTIKKGELPTISVAEKQFENNSIDRDKLLVVREKTMLNTNNLKTIYVQLKNKMLTIVNLINSKTMSQAANLAGVYKFYSQATVKNMKNILDVLSVRIKSASKMEKALAKTKNKCDVVTTEMMKQRKIVSGWLGQSYQFYHQQLMNNLLESSKIMTQITTLRLTTLTLYIKCLKDLQEAINATIQAVK